MKDRAIPSALAVLLAMYAAAPLRADVVTLSDGSTLVGTVERVGDGKLILLTQFAGKLEIDAAQIVKIATDGRVHVGLESGDVLVGRVSRNEAVRATVVETEMGGIPIMVEHIRSIWPEGAKSPEQLAMEKAIEESRAKWSLSMEAGVLIKEGNSDVLQTRGAVELRRKTKEDLLRFYARGAYSEEDDERSAAEVIVGSVYEYLITQRFFITARGEVEYDEFEDIDLRLTLTAGPGYYWIREDWHELKTSLGAGYQHETYRDGSRSDEPILDVGLGYRIDFNPWLRFTHEDHYLPTLSSTRDYRLTSDSAVVLPIGKSEVWKIKFGVELRYDALPAADRDRLDVTYFANLLAEFD